MFLAVLIDPCMQHSFYNYRLEQIEGDGNEQVLRAS